MRANLPAVLWLCALLGACTDSGTIVRATVDGIPAGAVALVTTAAVDNRESDPERFTLSGTGPQTLALRLPSSGSWFEMTTTAVDGANCEVGWGGNIVALHGYTQNPIEIGISLGGATANLCNTPRSPGMVYVPSDTFVLGCDGTDPDCITSQSPQRFPSLPAFEIDSFEVTVTAYQACVDAHVCSAAHSLYDPSTLPPLNARDEIDWFQAGSFCTWRGKRLPSEAEWEAAARGPNGQTYPWGEAPPSCTLANYETSSSSSGSTSCSNFDPNQELVGTHAMGASPNGVQDMGGNLLEWVNDWYADRSTLTDEEILGGPASGTEKVLKGGSFALPASALRCADRQSYEPHGTAFVAGVTIDAETNLFDTGFRCARSR